MHTRGQLFFIALLFITFMCPDASAQTRDALERYSILFSWNTAGSPELLSKKATAFKALKTPESISVSLGALFGDTRIVDHENGIEFLRAAKRAGLDYVIPAAPEFRFGVNTLLSYREFDDVPRFISANVIDASTREPLLDPYVVWEASGSRVCLVGFSDLGILRESSDENVPGIDVIPFDEAMTAISAELIRINPDVIIIAGRIDRESVVNMALRRPYLDAFISTNRSEGFSEGDRATTIVFISGKPVYIASEAGNHISLFSAGSLEGVETREFSDITLGDDYPPNDAISSVLAAITEEIKRMDSEEESIIHAGNAVAAILKDEFKTDAVLFERQALYYYPLQDSLTLFNFDKIIKTDIVLKTVSIKGSSLLSILETSRQWKGTPFQIQTGEAVGEGKINDIPIQADADYRILTTPFLLGCGNNYTQFADATEARQLEGTMRSVVENNLVLKDTRIREAEKPKYWTLTLALNIGANINRVNVDSDKNLYGKDIPKPFVQQKDDFSGLVTFTSDNNSFIYKRNDHDVAVRLDMRYTRSGQRNTQGNIIYSESGDDVKLNSKYTYHVNYKTDPFIQMNFDSELYANAPGKHPLTATLSSGFTRTFKRAWGIDLNLGIHGTRNYVTLENTFGTFGQVYLNKSFSEKSIIRNIISDTRVKWDPMANYHNAFNLTNTNSLKCRLWNNFNIDFRINNYAYRSTKYRKVAVGVVYYVLITYGMNWKF